ncbi:uncharacterized protein LOC141705837 [Apium graveolens]|uniref:uncharacterized protein LOC141705837 n=1 Tax=Apium graveolens TaxID=4045 RepID=UPI003D79C958
MDSKTVKKEEFNDTDSYLIQTPLEAQVNKIVRRDIMLGMMEVVKSEFQGGAVRMKLFLVSQADQTKSIATTQAKRLWVLVKEAFSHSDKMKSIMDTWRLDTKGANNLSVPKAFFNASELGLIHVGTRMENCLFAALHQRSLYIASKGSNAKAILGRRGANGRLLTSVILHNKAVGHKDIILTKKIEKEDLFLIIADGIWDVIKETDASIIVNNALLDGLQRANIAEKLLNEAVPEALPSADVDNNCGVLVILFKQRGATGPRDFIC